MNELIKLVEETNKDMVLLEAYQLFESQMMDLAEKYKNGEISKEEFRRLLGEGWFADIFRKPIRTDVYTPPTEEEQRERKTIKMDRRTVLRQKQKDGTITPQELKELGNLESMYRRRSGDIRKY